MHYWSQYVKEAMVTAPMGKGRVVEGFVRTTGLCGEAQEVYHEFTCASGPFDRARMMKELGDFAWYAAALWGWFAFEGEPLGLSLDMIAYRAVERPLAMDSAHLPSALMMRAGRFAEAMKKHLGHDKPADEQLFRGYLVDAIFTWARVVEECGFTPAEVLSANVAKLRARYKGGGFTAELANAPRTDG